MRSPALPHTRSLHNFVGSGTESAIGAARVVYTGVGADKDVDAAVQRATGGN